jgi:hypothetical protein
MTLGQVKAIAFSEHPDRQPRGRPLNAAMASLNGSQVVATDCWRGWLPNNGSKH